MDSLEVQETAEILGESPCNPSTDVLTLQAYIDVNIQQQIKTMGDKLTKELQATCSTIMEQLLAVKTPTRSEIPTAVGSGPCYSGGKSISNVPEDPIMGNRLKVSEGSAFAEDRHEILPQTVKPRKSTTTLSLSREHLKMPTQDPGDIVDLFASDGDFDGSADEHSSPEKEPEGDLDDHMRSALGDTLEQGDTAPEIHASLATATKKLWHHVLDKQKISEKLSSLKMPDNCSYLTVPRTNDEIFSKLKPDIAAQDVRLQQHQRVLATTSIPVVHILNEIASLRAGDVLEASTIKNLTTYAVDALTLLSHQNNRTLQDRKNKIVRTLPNDLKGLRNVNEPDSGLLFGADIITKIQNIKRGFHVLDTPKPFKPPFKPFTFDNRRNNRGRSDKPYGRRNDRISTYSSKNKKPFSHPSARGKGKQRAAPQP